MQVILLERTSAGEPGSVVKVKNGYARNFLLPKGKAILATKENIADIEARKAEIEAANKKALENAREEAKNFESMEISIQCQASEEGRLFGSVKANDIVARIKEIDSSLNCTKDNIIITQAIREIGEYDLIIRLHPEVDVKVKLNITRFE